MKKLFLPFSLVLLLVSCTSEATESEAEKKSKPEPSLTACECKRIYDSNPTNNPKNKGKNRDSLSNKWAIMWEPCMGIDMTEAPKCR